MEPYASNLLNYPFTIRIQTSHKKGESGKIQRLLCEDIFTFDIETTSFFYESDKVPFLYKTGYDPDYWSDVYAGGVCYLWQFGVNDRYFYGRTLDEFYALLDDFPPDLHIRIFIHSFQFEWHWLDKLTWDKVFAKTPHNPIKASCKEHPNIEFLCTYALENRSLASWGESLGVPKLMGYLDYNQMRTPLTPLTEDELKYGERDLEVMYVGLKEELRTYGSVFNLPLTATGKIRRIIKDMLMSDNDYKNYIKRLIPEHPYQYKTSMKIFGGGSCAPNRCFVGRTVYNPDGKHGGHYDFCSSYPFQMVIGRVPCSGWAYRDPEDEGMPSDDMFEDHAYKMHLRFTNIRSEIQNTYIHKDKCYLEGYKLDGSRVFKASLMEIWCTEDDWCIIKRAYSWDKLEILEMWEARKDYLPLPYVEYVLELFHNKSAFKGIPEKADEYRCAKSYVNSLYGLMATALLQGEVNWDDATEHWSVSRITDTMIKEHLDKLRMWKDRRYFVSYDWGCWISNSSRRRLWELILKYDEHVIYHDTDSLFTDIQIDFTEYNNDIDRRLKELCEKRGLDFEKTRPTTPNGKQSFLGHMVEEEEVWTEFRTLRSKCYCERWKSDGQLHMTISGVDKSAVSVLKNDINNLKDGTVFDKDEPDVHKLLHTYIDEMPDITFPDGYVSHQRRGVNLRPNGYKIKLEKSYEEIVKRLDTYAVDEYENHLKSVWYDDIDELVDYACRQIAGKDVNNE